MLPADAASSSKMVKEADIFFLGEPVLAILSVVKLRCAEMSVTSIDCA